MWILLTCRASLTGVGSLVGMSQGQYVMMDHIHLRHTGMPIEGSLLTGTYIWWQPTLLGGVGIFF